MGAGALTLVVPCISPCPAERRPRKAPALSNLNTHHWPPFFTAKAPARFVYFTPCAQAHKGREGFLSSLLFVRHSLHHSRPLPNAFRHACADRALLHNCCPISFSHDLGRRLHSSSHLASRSLSGLSYHPLSSMWFRLTRQRHTGHLT
jgi:hypothetical protein